MWNWLKAKAKIASELSLTDWLAMGEAWLGLFFFYISIRLTSFERLNQIRNTKANSPITDRLGYAQHVQRLVHLTSRLHLLSITCLPRALTLRQMLNRRGIPAQIQIGVTKTPQGVHAHAWIEVDGQQVGEAEEVTERFKKFDLRQSAK